ncbi:MAG: hypothetical protein JWP95_1940 [Actinotalea sp.]|jgi:hypothetical protein|nr:hypothetical protein [Actinotalea sp.]
MSGDIIQGGGISTRQGIHDRDGGTCNVCGAVMGNAAVHEGWHTTLGALIGPR